jgi:hypothetical protein
VIALSVKLGEKPCGERCKVNEAKPDLIEQAMRMLTRPDQLLLMYC